MTDPITAGPRDGGSGSAAPSAHDNEISGREVEQNAFQRLADRIAVLNSDDMTSVAEILQEATERNLPGLLVRVLVERCAAVLNVSCAAVLMSLKDQAHTHPVHGYLRNTDAVVSALRKDLAADVSHITTDMEATYVYRGVGVFEGIWERVTDDVIEEHLLRHYPAHATSRHKRREIIARLKASTRVADGEGFTQAPAGLCLLNGQLLLNGSRDGFDLVPHDPKYRARNKLDIQYDAAATAPQFEDGMSRIVGGCEVRRRAILEFLACAIFGSRPANDVARGCLLLIGQPRTGKSTLIKLAEHFFTHSEVASLGPQHWAKPENVVQLSRASLNVVPELDPHSSINGSVVKRVLSQESVEARYMRQNSFTFTPKVMNVWAANEVPRINERNDSLNRRFLVITMGQTLSDQEAAEDFLDVVGRETAGVINVLTQAFLDVQRRHRFIVPNDSDFVVARMQLGDRLGELWVRRSVRSAPGRRITTSQIQSGLRALALELGMDAESVTNGTSKQVAQALYNRHNAVRRSAGGAPFYEGVELVEGAPALPLADATPRAITLEDL